MSIAELHASNRRQVSDRSGSGEARTGARERVLELVTQLSSDQLAVTEQILDDMLARQPRSTRGLTESEVDALAQFGVSTDDLMVPPTYAGRVRGELEERAVQNFSFTVSEAASVLGVTPARVRQRCAAGTLLAQRRSDGWHLPRFQFPDDKELPGWATVAASITPGTPMMLVERVLVNPSVRLRAQGIGASDDEEPEGISPATWLARGGDPQDAAAAFDDAIHRLP